MKIESRYQLKRLQPGSLGEVFVKPPAENQVEKNGQISGDVGEICGPDNIVLADHFDTESLGAAVKNIASGFVRMPTADIDITSKPVMLDTYPTLFFKFADLDLREPENLKTFVMDHGLLGNRSLSFEIREDGIDYISEPLELWILLQLELRTIIRLWRSLRGAGRKYNRALLKLSM